jgi:hypothetical protein
MKAVRRQNLTINGWLSTGDRLTVHKREYCSQMEAIYKGILKIDE